MNVLAEMERRKRGHDSFVRSAVQGISGKESGPLFIEPAPACPLVSVIIPVCNDAERLEVCLRALEAQTYPTATYEIIVVDNGSAASIEPVVARYAHARACFEQHPGSYAARNKGLSLARGEVIAFTDSDCIPTPDWLERGVTKLLGDPTCGMIGGRIDVFCRTPGRPTSAELYDCTRGLLQRKYIEVRGFGATANVFTRRRILDAVGTFDATLKSCGDVEWGHRVAAAGVPACLCR